MPASTVLSANKEQPKLLRRPPEDALRRVNPALPPYLRQTWLEMVRLHLRHKAEGRLRRLKPYLLQRLCCLPQAVQGQD